MEEARQQADFAPALEATRCEREEIEAQIAGLRSRRDALLVREERLRCEADAASPSPFWFALPSS